MNDATKVRLYTYHATVRRVVAGDTLALTLLLAPGMPYERELRLRGLACPEISTAAGRAAKAFVEGLLKPGDTLVVCTTKSDKYEYVADAFITPPGGGPEIFLNNALLAGGYAVRYDDGAREE